MFNLIKRTFVATICIICAALIMSSCAKTPGGKKYSSVTEDIQAAKDAVSAGQEKQKEFTDLSVNYDFELRCQVGDKLYTMGTENTVSYLGRGTENEGAYRLNTVSRVDGIKENERFWLKDGYIYSKQYQTNFKAKGDVTAFLEYTASAQLSADEEYFNTESFSHGALYSCKDGTKEAVFTEANDAIKEGVAIFIGLDKLSYIYEVREVTLIVSIDESGHIYEKHLTFSVDYYSEQSPENVLTYEGDFAFFLKSSVAGEIEVLFPDLSLEWQELSNIKYLSSVTDGGYDVLGSFTGLDVTYEKYIKNSDLTDEYYMQTNVHFTELYQNEKYKYGSIDSQTVSTPSTVSKTSEGVFIDTNGYHERMYDVINKKHKEDVDKAENPYTVYDMMSMVATTVSGERLLAEDIRNLKVSEDEEKIVFRYLYTSDAMVLYCEYLLSAFTGNSASANLSANSIYVNKGEGEITIRKSDGCLLGHTVDVSVLVEGAIKLESRTKITVNSTGLDIDVLNLTDWNDKYPKSEDVAV